MSGSGYASGSRQSRGDAPGAPGWPWPSGRTLLITVTPASVMNVRRSISLFLLGAAAAAPFPSSGRNSGRANVVIPATACQGTLCPSLNAFSWCDGVGHGSMGPKSRSLSWTSRRPLVNLQTLLGIDYPIIQAPMAGVQGSALAVAVSNAGGLGSLPCAMLDADGIRPSWPRSARRPTGRSTSTSSVTRSQSRRRSATLRGGTRWRHTSRSTASTQRDSGGPRPIALQRRDR